MGIKQRIGNWLIGRKPNVNHTFDEEDRELSLKLRQSRAERKLLLEELEKVKIKADIDELKEEIASYSTEDEEDSVNNPDTLMFALISKLLSGGQTVQPSNAVATSQSTKLNGVTPTMTIEQMREIKANIPKKYLKIAKKLDDETLKALIRQQFPGIDDSSLVTALSVVKE